MKNKLFNPFKRQKLKVIIVGAPRSGTSFLAGLVARMGISPGTASNLREANEHNPYGYYENMDLMQIDHELLKKFGGSVMTKPSFPEDWIELCKSEKREILKIVTKEGLELYKGNMLVYLADLYKDIFPTAKWIYIKREKNDVVKSLIKSSKEKVEKGYYENVFDTWTESFQRTSVAEEAMTITYSDFHMKKDSIIKKISDFLNIELDEHQFKNCQDFFKPKIK